MGFDVVTLRYGLKGRNVTGKEREIALFCVQQMVQELVDIHATKIIGHLKVIALSAELVVIEIEETIFLTALTHRKLQWHKRLKDPLHLAIGPLSATRHYM